MESIFDWVILTAEWAKDETGTFLSALGLITTFVGAMAVYLRRRLIAKYEGAIGERDKLQSDLETMTKNWRRADDRLEVVDPMRTVDKISEATHPDDKFKLSDEFFKAHQIAIPKIAMVLARAKIEEALEGGNSALEAAERYLTLGLAADPQDAHVAVMLDEVRAQRIAMAEGEDSVDFVIGTSNDLEALKVGRDRLMKQGKYRMAIVLAERHLDLTCARFGSQSVEPAKSMQVLGRASWQAGDAQTAEALFRQAIEIGEEVVGKENYASLLNSLATALKLQARYSEAEPLFREAISIEAGPAYLTNLALLLQKTGRYDEAEPLYRQAMEIGRKALGEDHAEYARSLNNLALLLQEKGRYDEAEPLYRQAMEITRMALGEDHPDYAKSVNNLAILMEKIDRLDEAERLYRQAMEIDRTALSENHPDYATDLNNLAELLKDTGRFEDAAPLYDQAVAILERSLGPEHPDTQTVKANREAFHATWAAARGEGGT